MNPNLTIYKEYPYFLDGQFESENIQEKLIENHLAQPLEDAGLYIDEECGFLHAQPLVWDTVFFGRNMARLVHLYCVQESSITFFWKRFEYWLEKNKINHVTSRINVKNTFTINYLFKKGFELISGKYLTRLDLGKTTLFHSVDSSLDFRFATGKDVESLLKVSSRNFLENRFFKDDYFTSEKAEKVYDLWVENEINTSPGNVIVATENDKILGFSIAKKYEGLSSLNYGFIELIAVSSDYQKKGIGKKILTHSLKYLRGKGVNVVFANIVNTNTASLKMFQAVGFNVYSTLIELRKIVSNP